MYYINFSVTVASPLTGTLTVPAGIGFWIASAPALNETLCDVYRLPCPAPAPGTNFSGWYSFGDWGRLTWVQINGTEQPVEVNWSSIVLSALDFNFSGANNVLPPGSWSILLANPWTQTETVTVDPAIVAGNVTLQSLSFTESGLPTGANWSVTLTENSPGVTIEAMASLTRWSDGSSSILFTVSEGSYMYAASAPGYWVASGTVGVSGAAPATAVLSFGPGSGPPSNPSTPFLPVWAASIGVAFLAIGAIGLTMTAYRYRAKEELRGRVLAARLFDEDWELGAEREPPVPANR
jgi:hypothetical protein